MSLVQAILVRQKVEGFPVLFHLPRSDDFAVDHPGCAGGATGLGRDAGRLEPCGEFVGIEFASRKGERLEHGFFFGRIKFQPFISRNSAAAMSPVRLFPSRNG